LPAGIKPGKSIKFACPQKPKIKNIKTFTPGRGRKPGRDRFPTCPKSWINREVTKLSIKPKDR